ncbi:hypothetical protein RQP46_005214 [Phenoliferia psychrophenolica]
MPGAWHCSGATNSELIHNLVTSQLLTSPRAIAAFNAVDRAHFVTKPRDAYIDSPSSIGFGATITAPHMHAHAVEDLMPALNPGAKVLDVGCGSGYLLAIFRHLVGPTGVVLGIDHLPALSALSIANLRKSTFGIEALDSEPPTIKVVCADGRKGSEVAEWDVIHVGAAAPELPEPLIEKDSDGIVSKTRLFGVRYIPLTDAELQHP